MNKLTGIISNVESDDHLSIIEMKVNNVLLKTVIIETKSTVPFLHVGREINVMFKESEVSIAKNFSGRISLQNRIHCKIKKIKKGKLLSYIILEFNGIEISSIITTAAVGQLNLKTGDEVTALIKTNEIIVAPQ